MNRRQVSISPGGGALRLRHSLGAMTALLALCALGRLAPGFEAGDHYAIELRPPAGYRAIAAAAAATSAGARGAEIVWSHTLTHPGATYIALHFADFDLAPGELLFVSDDKNGQGYALEGRGKLNAGVFWAQHIDGDTARLDLVVDAATAVATTANFRGLHIDEYVAGYADMRRFPAPEAICGVDDKRNAVCYRDSHPLEYERSRAVARLLINGSSLCTGWLASGDNALITNNHCIASAADALNTDYEFMAEAPNCGDTNCFRCYPGVVFSGATLLKTSAELDCTAVRIASGNPAQTYGWLTVDNRAAVPGEEIYIPQHPGGKAKQLAIFSTDARDTSGICRVFSIAEPPCVAGAPYNDVGYYADTEGGSSGSPVMARSSHRVIALHHCADCPNVGVPITRVFDEFKDYLFPGPQGALLLDAAVYSCQSVIGVEARDGDLAGQGACDVTLATSGGDLTTVTLLEVAPGAAIFRGAVPTQPLPINPSDGALQAADGETVTAAYADANDGAGAPAIVTAQASFDCVAPVVSNLALEPLADGACVASFDTDEPATASGAAGPVCGDAASTAAGAPGVRHRLAFFELAECSRYALRLAATDPAGNTAVAGNGGACHAVTTSATRERFADSFEPYAQPGWTHAAAIGIDGWTTAASALARSPKNVFRFAPQSSGVTDGYLVTPPFDSGGALSFWHVYNLEFSYDGAVAEITTDGLSWTDLGPHILRGGYDWPISTLYSCPIGGRMAWTGANGGAATPVVIDLSAFPGIARVRFRFAADVGVISAGWLIDDVRVIAPAPCAPAPSIPAWWLAY